MDLSYSGLHFLRKKKRVLRFNIKEKDRVLDLGCGDGVNIGILTSKGIKNITALDMNKRFLNTARKNYPGIKLILASVEKLPFKDSSFDVVLVDSVFHHLSSYEKTVREIKRILVSGGLLCFAEPHGGGIRRLIDWFCTKSISRLIPILNQRRRFYLREKKLMDKWLKNEQDFLNLLILEKFKKQFCHTDQFAVFGQYEKT